MGFIRRIWHLIVLGHLYFWGITLSLCILYNFVNPPITTLMIQRKLIRHYPVKRVKFIKIEDMPKRTVASLMNLEDANFPKHWGFEWKYMQKAWKANLRSKKIRFGGSTITNQLARTLFLTTDRNYLRKYLEFWVSIELELTMSKKRMLELYMNYIEWGKGIFGIEQASLHYYGKSASELNREESRKLVAIVPNPIRYSPQTLQQNRIMRHRYRLLKRYY